MKILLISGFLGAGKTTFIKELINRTDERPVIMENEYGDNNLDSNELRQSTAKEEDIQILEFMEGCVCCTMKDSFVNSVLTVFSSLNPEYLIIEPTGVGKLSSIIENLKPILNTAVFLLRPVVVISPDNYRDNMKEWPSLYSDQIANASIVVFSKCEHTDPDIIADVVKEVKKINPAAEIVSEHYTLKDKEWWDGLFNLKGGAKEEAESMTAATAGRPGGADSGSAAEDSFSQVSINRGGFRNPGELIQLLEDCLHGEFGHIARAKGTLWVSNEVLRFDLADRMYAITDSPDDGCQCVFIGKNLDEKKLRKRLCGGERNSRIMLK
ncbi:GTP-binding protein [Butyrivibrio sp. X503]|uniref:CobW family GTP-binding protein n=1 Tax=Butyrivibrio sp. X503 TaxID=2364878 RepID=UPI000EAAAB57|nr:GTP-binding protein [Butyrivibrio sp. X503]RKM56668.1 GTP-binding protein [Butyrivibrio sp. X503]